MKLRQILLRNGYPLWFSFRLQTAAALASFTLYFFTGQYCLSAMCCIAARSLDASINAQYDISPVPRVHATRYINFVWRILKSAKTTTKAGFCFRFWCCFEKMNACWYHLFYLAVRMLLQSEASKTFHRNADRRADRQFLSIQNRGSLDVVLLWFPDHEMGSSSKMRTALRRSKQDAIVLTYYASRGRAAAATFS